MIDLTLDNTHDLVIADYDLDLSAGVAVVAQRLEIILKLFKGEWYLEENAGVPYYQDILTSKPRLSIVEAILRSAIMASPEVESMPKFNMEYVASTRKLNVDFKVVSSEGEVEVSEVLP